ncbi:MAG: bifunctional adenosylcobinamide kinase/adenosylcobinamide-phosphate guanylyltransferase [Alteromonadaceae bacterium]|nr:MAG: bifunctional adenosylcobinamide kinase/adenosylcobinamide-phosphate guanylyltransferase [Alteromonadaceae bacterium]
MKELILGGARSGKSRFAETRALEGSNKLIYLATASAGDGEMHQRIHHHQERRCERWQLHEEGIALADAMLQFNDTNTTILVDCLTLWLSNCMAQNCVEAQQQALLETLPRLDCDVFMVSNEVGSGIVPLGQLSRDFVDHSGFMHQALAQLCERVTLVMAGLPLALKTDLKNKA